MYEEFYGFVQSPFTLAPDPRFFYSSESHEEAIRQLLQSIRRQEGFIVLTGDIGTGKTTLCRTLLGQLEETTFTSLILNPLVSVEELLREILLDFGVVSREAVRSGRIAGASKHELATALHDFLRSLAPLDGSGVLIIDEAQHLSPQVLEQIRVLSNLDAGDAKRLQVVLVGQLNLLDVLAQAEMRQLHQRISLKARLNPLTRDEVEAYIGHRLTVAQGSSTVTFEPAAIELVHVVSGGIPRVINLLCDRALMLGAQQGTDAIARSQIAEAAAALALPVPEPATPRRSVRRWILVAVVLVLLALALLLLVPWEGLVDAGVPALPDRPAPAGPPALQPVAVPADLPL
jgi:general secretion pathway protein A